MARTRSESIPFYEYQTLSGLGIKETIDELLPLIVRHLGLKRVSDDYRFHLNLLLSNYLVAYGLKGAEIKQ